ncbi:ComEA family DNA-binding protein [Methylobacterium radiodurans]|uniref:DNA uptake protein n=1 Tax=Methylobacterium radiodurans TaxID=2202828 RepID=A0A2U8VR61_9HYPH|nr:helix-hairpin-helix domain-containing protein [Methylobacterium radiodurans]AWN36259.1 DNA uptake protein [Methylobacterium radiodurans]
MLSGSAIVRVSVLLVVAGVLAALAQFLWIRSAPQPVAEVPTVAAPRKEPSPEPEPPARALPPEADFSVRPSVPPVQAAPAIREAAPSAQATIPASPPAPDPAAAAQESADPRAVALVDLNTATLTQLNGLRGGGNIGRAIIQKRPYGSVDQLLAKRVLSRATYERIKDQVTVQ